MGFFVEGLIHITELGASTSSSMRLARNCEVSVPGFVMVWALAFVCRLVVLISIPIDFRVVKEGGDALSGSAAGKKRRGGVRCCSGVDGCAVQDRATKRAAKESVRGKGGDSGAVDSVRRNRPPKSVTFSALRKVCKITPGHVALRWLDCLRP